MEVIPYKIYRAKMQTGKNANVANETFETTTTTNAQTGIVAGVSTSAAARSQPATNAPQLKTQIAKISYVSSVPVNTQKVASVPTAKAFSTMVQKLPTECFPEDEETDLVTNKMVQEFNRQKNERAQDIQDIQHMLNDLSKSPQKKPIQAENESSETNTYHSHKSVIQAETSAAIKQTSRPAVIKPTTFLDTLSKESTTTRPSYQRSKSDMHYEQKANVTSRPISTLATSNMSVRQRSRSSTALPTTAETKHKFYNPQDARRYMEEQRKKRRSNTAASALIMGQQKTAMEKEAIKKRLEQLRESTRKIISKNVKKQQHKTESTPKITADAVTGVLTFKKPTPRQRKSTEACETVLSPTVQQQTELPPKMEAEKLPSSKVHDKAPLTENKKRIGLLRKPDFKDHSYSAITELSFNKENVALELMPAQLTETHEIRQKDLIRENVPPGQRPEVIEHMVIDENKQQDMDLEVPTAQLKTSAKKSLPLRSENALKTETQKVVAEQKSVIEELPFWLKPTSVQVYPYNFIMAVRRKLEAITKTPAQFTTTVDAATSASVAVQATTKNQTTSTEDMGLKSGSIKLEDVKETAVKDEQSAPPTSPPSYLEKCKTLTHNSEASQSDFVSNISSISMQLPASNSVSDISSLELETGPSQHSPKPSSKKIKTELAADDTTVSSAVFNSMDVALLEPKDGEIKLEFQFAKPRPLSPLSLETVDKMKIESNSRRDNSLAARHVNTTRGDRLEPTEQCIDFNQLLDDFNRSLSQVIMVNEQLKSTIDKSQRIFRSDSASDTRAQRSPRRTLEDEYTTDFEPTSNEQRLTVSEQKNSGASNQIKEETFVAEEVSESMRSDISSEAQTTPSSHNATTTSNATCIISRQSICEQANQEQKSAYISTHINAARGDFLPDSNSKSEVASEVQAEEEEETEACQNSKTVANSSASTLGRDIASVFQRRDLELSCSFSEGSLNYSSIGMYEKLIQNEATKSEHLSALLKMREKALLDRTKSQIAWLEVQKERYKSKGLLIQIAAVKKKQRAILLKMEKEREEIKR